MLELVAVVAMTASSGSADDFVLDGSIATVIAQHPIAGVEGKKFVYFDLAGGSQTIAYVPKSFDCKGAVMVEGRYYDFEAGGKRQKSEEKFKVRHLDVEKWQCLPASVDELLEKGDEAKLLELGRAALPGLVRLSSKPAAAAVLEKLVKPKTKVTDWPKWWRARWKKSLEELRGE
ncbi:MAG: hypothetical protein JNK82_16165 [Myxococcaceae bacterium]|nr:hypothetical protein [Myxococcaceae bacterium]